MRRGLGTVFAIWTKSHMSTGAVILAAGLCGFSLVIVGCRSASEPGRSAAVVSTARVETASRIVALALAHVGAPYRWGGADPRGFDCSGFVMYVYRQAGVSLPHGAVKQYRFGTSVSRKHLAPGDIVFFDRLNHSGIYIGDGRFVHASKSGDAVKVSRLDEAWFERRWVGARRLLVADRQALSED
jgi:cell wall-associated NlpC family hydrolase